MHKEFRKLLETAIGRSEHVIAINLDIRGFSSFCQDAESFDVGTFIKIVYSKIIDEYFENASFYKPTGDGLIIIISCKKENIRENVNTVVESCLNLVENFSSLVADEPIINFPTPSKIGIGIARGGACCIIEKEQNKILDYSGRILNLASRLMDLARPSGVVISDNLGINLLEKKYKDSLLEDDVYLRGVAEEHPVKVYYTKKYTLIPKSYHLPIKEEQWETDLWQFSYKDLRVVFKTGGARLSLSNEPSDLKRLLVKLSFQHPKVIDFFRYVELSIDNQHIFHISKGKVHQIKIVDGIFLDEFEKAGIPEDAKITIRISYPVK